MQALRVDNLARLCQRTAVKNWFGTEGAVRPGGPVHAQLRNWWREVPGAVIHVKSGGVFAAIQYESPHPRQQTLIFELKCTFDELKPGSLSPNGERR